MSQKFENPPINELVIGIYFKNPLIGFRSEHIGVFWNQVKEEYGKISQQPPIGPIIETNEELFPLPRFWMISENESMLIQIQKNAFLFNWRSRDDKYPDFDTVKSKFDKIYIQFCDFLKSEVGISNLDIDTCELTYVNIISESDYWQNLNDTQKVIPSFNFIETGIENCKPSDFNYVNVYKVDEQLSLKVNIGTAQLREQPETQALNFEIRTTGRFDNASKSEADKWFTHAHDIAGKCFVNMTDKNIQNEFWKRIQ